MGTVVSRITRPLKNWNIESRAHKAISKEKRAAAPTFPGVNRQKELVDRIDPDYRIVSQRKDPQLDDYLKKVYVQVCENAAEAPIDSRLDPNRPLPKEKFLQERFEYGFFEPEEVKLGKISLRKTLDLLANYSKDPDKYTNEFIAKEYKLELKDVVNILEYYKLYEVIHMEFMATRQDKVARRVFPKIPKTIPISLKTGVQVPLAEKKKKQQDESAEQPEVKIYKKGIQPPKIDQIGEK